jgi:hypothetical protein
MGLFIPGWQCVSNRTMAWSFDDDLTFEVPALDDERTAIVRMGK